MTKKVLKLVGACDDCPNKSYYSGGRSECTATGTILPYNEGHRIPGWCPLTDYPSTMMERQRERIADLEKMLEAATAAKVA